MATNEKDIEDLIETLHNVPLFSKYNDSQLTKVAKHMSEIKFAKGKFLIQQGQDADSFFIVVDGEAEVLIDGKQIGSISASDYCGELALIQNGKRTASIKAITDMRVYCIDKNVFKSQLQEEMRMLFYKRNRVHLEQPQDLQEEEKDPNKHYPNSHEVRWILRAVETNDLFKHMNKTEKLSVIESMYRTQCKKNEILMKEGDAGDKVWCFLFSFLFFFLLIFGKIAPFFRPQSNKNKNK